jgi:hypothetical protein
LFGSWCTLVFATHRFHEHVTSTKFVVGIAFKSVDFWNRKICVLSRILHPGHRGFSRQFEILQCFLRISMPSSTDPDSSVVEFNLKDRVEGVIRESGAQPAAPDRSFDATIGIRRGLMLANSGCFCANSFQSEFDQQSLGFAIRGGWGGRVR